MPKEHEHRRPTACSCYSGGIEPNETCPVHGEGEWPPRCAACGQFMKPSVHRACTEEGVEIECDIEYASTPYGDYGMFLNSDGTVGFIFDGKKVSFEEFVIGVERRGFEVGRWSESYRRSCGGGILEG